MTAFVVQDEARDTDATRCVALIKARSKAVRECVALVRALAATAEMGGGTPAPGTPAEEPPEWLSRQRPQTLDNLEEVPMTDEAIA